MNEDQAARVRELEGVNDRLRKAVNWLRGSNHDAGALHNGTVETCDVWECERARAVLADARNTLREGA